MTVDAAPIVDHDLLESVMALARRAGIAIMPWYRDNDLEVEAKADESPVTSADRAAQKVIETGLRALDPGSPVLSEEGPCPAWEQRRRWHRYWLVDPLDGTREFVEGRDEFTVNIALIEHGRPVLGVVLLPVSRMLYAGLVVGAPAAFREDAAGQRATLATRSAPSGGEAEPLAVAVSRTYAESDLAPLREPLETRFGPLSLAVAGSSLKFCRVAAGEVDLYPRYAPTCEWDTAAGQAIVEAAGGAVRTFGHGPLRYNRKDSLLNPGFYAVGDPRRDWREWLPAGD